MTKLNLLCLLTLTLVSAGCGGLRTEEPKLVVKATLPAYDSFEKMLGGHFHVNLDISYTGNADQAGIYVEAYRRRGTLTQEMLQIGGSSSGAEPGPIKGMRSAIRILDSKMSPFVLQAEPMPDDDFYLILSSSEFVDAGGTSSKEVIPRDSFLGSTYRYGDITEYDLSKEFIPIFYWSSPGGSLRLKDGQPDIQPDESYLILYLKLHDRP